MSYSLDAPQAFAYNLYSTLNEHPKWAPWLESVSFDKESGLSTWTMAYLGMKYSWRANNTQYDPPHLIQWESLDGLPNKGQVEFFSQSDTSAPTEGDPSKSLTIKLTVSYDLPMALAMVLRALGPMTNTFINHMLLADLKRFHAVLDQALLASAVPISEEGVSGERNSSPENDEKHNNDESCADNPPNPPDL